MFASLTLPTTAFGLSFHHFGLATARPEQTVRFLYGLGYEVSEQVHDPLQNVHLWFCSHPSMPAVELVAPAEGGGPLDAIIVTSDTNMYHVCYEAVNLEVSLRAIKAAGLRMVCISAAKPAILFGNRRVSFYMIKDFGIIEILESS